MITYNNGIFHLKTKDTSYVLGVFEGKLLNLYWGEALNSVPCLEDMLPIDYFRTFSSSDIMWGERKMSTNDLTMEYSEYGRGDFRTPAFEGIDGDFTTASDLKFDSYEVADGKYSIEGMPAVYSEEGDNVKTLKINLIDSYSGLKVTLLYGVFEDLNVITRAVEFQNTGDKPYRLNKALSMTVDFNCKDFEFIHLSGVWARERKPQRCPVQSGTMQVESIRGTSSHIHNPFIALVSPDATEDYGDAYGFNLVYSGNFIAGVQKEDYDITRAFMGIHPTGFSWVLEKGDTFKTPEAVLVYSNKGLGEMSRKYHKLYRTRLCRGVYRDVKRPVLINNWEATYFDFNEEKILDITKAAADLGVELMVLDDGWFGVRDQEDCSLGDWTPDLRKLPNGFKGLAEKVNAEGLKFGLWFEPEMISPNSDLYRAHPDWCLHQADRERTLGRSQLVLDLSRKEVCDYVKGFMSDILSTVNISYIKWDMNRYITEIGSPAWDGEKQGEIAHRYMLGLYDIMEYLTTRFPHVLFEGCSGGGGRFDPGILYYMPQIWTSDDTDAVERLDIQYGTSLCYPYSTMGAHVSAVPNHQVYRTTPIKFRGDVAICGQLGYELNLGILSDDDKAEVREQIKAYHELANVFHNGDLYRLITPENSDVVANEFISEDKNTVVVCTYVMRARPNNAFKYAKLKGLDLNAIYVDQKGREYTGDYLTHFGFKIAPERDYDSKIIVLNKKIQWCFL